MKTRKVSSFKRAFELALRFVMDCRAERSCTVVPGRAARLIRCRNDQPYGKACLLIQPRTILGCHPRLLKKLLS